MAAYESAGETDEWYTPKYIFDSLGLEFDVDVASPASGPRHTPCIEWYSEENDGLSKCWHGTVWMNPPFGNQKTKIKWLEKFFDHGDGIALIPDRTSAKWWQHYAKMADIICFVSPKIKFERPDGTIGMSPGTGTCLFAIGDKASRALISSGLGNCMVNFC